jgi:hypothetical protein
VSKGAYVQFTHSCFKYARASDPRVKITLLLKKLPPPQLTIIGFTSSSHHSMALKL